MAILDAAGWDKFLSTYPNAHLLQTSAWGALKSAFGWTPAWVAAGSAGAQVLFRRLPLGLSLAYLPKGPVGPGWDALWPEIDRLCRRHRAVFLKVEPDLWEESGCAQEVPPRFRLGRHTIQPPRTIVLDLDAPEIELLNRMKQKTRYNIRLALKKGIIVYPSSDLGQFHRLMQVTSERDGFGVHSLAYYQRAYELFHPRGECELLFADYEGETLAALMVFAHGSRAWYFYGASSNLHRDSMPTYLIQWEAMRWARAHGCLEYDLWGVPDADLETLEAGFAGRSDGLWGVYRFKRGFGGDLRRARGPWDRVYLRAFYALYRLRLEKRAGEQAG